MSGSRLVYSTDDGDRRREAAPDRQGPQPPADGVVRVFREKGGRGGKVVTLVHGLPGGELRALTSELKRLCGSGGAAKDGVVVIQGDHREKVAERLRAKGYVVRLAGG